MLRKEKNPRAPEIRKRDRLAGNAGRPRAECTARPPGFFIFEIAWMFIVCLSLSLGGGVSHAAPADTVRTGGEATRLDSSAEAPSDSSSVTRPDVSGVPYLARFLKNTGVYPRDEIRALWVVRDALTSKDRIDRLIDFAVRGRFHLLFAQVRGRGDAYYRSRFEPPALDLEVPLSEFDPLSYLLEKAHETDLSVHAWVNVLYVWSDSDVDPPPGHVVRRHPGWIITDPRGIRMDERGVDAWKREGIGGYFLSPAIAGVRDHIVRVIEDLAVRFPIDGIHLDYIRYPGPGYGFDQDTRRAFALTWGLDPLALGADRERLIGTVGGEAITLLDSLTVEMRAQAVDSLVIAIREALPDLPLSAAVIPEPDRAHSENGQNWPGWVHRKYVDFVVPMAYAYEPPELVRRMRIVRNLIGRDRFLVGLPLFEGRARYLAPAVSALRSEGIIGYSLFSYNVMEDEPFAVQFFNRVFFGESDGP